MYPPQAVALRSSLGIEWDLFRRIPHAQEREIDPAVVTSSVAVPISPATPLQPGQVYRDKTGLSCLQTTYTPPSGLSWTTLIDDPASDGGAPSHAELRD